MIFESPITPLLGFYCVFFIRLSRLTPFNPRLMFTHPSPNRDPSCLHQCCGAGQLWATPARLRAPNIQILAPTRPYKTCAKFQNLVSGQ